MSALQIVGVPSSAAAYCVGTERAPAALRLAGLVQELTSPGRPVRDLGDVTERRWKPDRDSPFAQNLHDESAALRDAIELSSGVIAAGDRLLMLGGSCTVALAVCASLVRSVGGARLIYVDRHLDLNTPGSTREGSLSWMGMAHALALPGAAGPLVHLDGAAPLLRPENLCYLGVDLDQTTTWERDRAAELDLRIIGQSEVARDPSGAAEAALRALPVGDFAVHLDVDVLDFLDAPLAEDVNGRNSGLTIEQIGTVLATLWSDPRCRALSVGQLDPNHAEADSTSLTRFVQMLGRALHTH